MRKPRAPAWSSWPVEIGRDFVRRLRDGGLLHRKMAERGFCELNLERLVREMLDRARDFGNRETGRCVIRTRLLGAEWELVVRPDTERRVLVAVTAYPFGDERDEGK